jgi:hypothetical protein
MTLRENSRISVAHAFATAGDFFAATATDRASEGTFSIAFFIAAGDFFAATANVRASEGVFMITVLAAIFDAENDLFAKTTNFRENSIVLAEITRTTRTMQSLISEKFTFRA